MYINLRNALKYCIIFSTGWLLFRSSCQLLGFRDFLNNLDRNLETTKECFFTIYHLVKSNIDQGMADGSLEVDSDAEEGAPSSKTETAPSNSNPVNAEASTEPSPTASMRISRPDVSNMDPASSLKAQQVYLAALQDQTAVEREEIARLLRQRDQLAERLKTLKAAALTAKETAESKADDRNDENTLVCQAPIAVPESTDLAEQAEPDEDEDVHPLLVSHLEAKKRELEGLKAQLALLRKAEERIAALNDSTRDIISSTTEVVGPDEVTPNPGVPVVKSRTSLARRNLTAASTGLQKTRFSDGSGEPSVSRGSSRLVESTNASGDQIPVNASGKFRGESFQVLEASGPNSNTEKLYENILEARIRREEQRRQGSTTAGVQNGILENDKSLQHAGYVGGTSVATSQDRTTLATWGGSSPIASGSTSRSSCPAEDEEAVSVSGSLPQSAEIATTSDVVPTVNTSRVISPPSGSAVYHRRSDRPSGDHSNSGLREPSMHKGISLAPDNAILGSLPQVGHSPSPIRRGQSAETTRTSSLKTLNKQSTESGGQPVSEPLQPNTAYFAKMSSALSGPYMTEEHSPELRSRAFTDRIQHLEHSVSQLYQICHSLMQENTQLNSAVTQLLAHSTVTPIQHSQWPQTLVTFPMSDGTSAPAPIPQTVSGGIFGNLLVSQSSQIQPSFVQSNPVVATPCTQVMGGPSHASVCGASMMDSGHGPANSNHEQMQLLMRRLMQQQIGYFNAQTELQRVLYQQSQTRQPLDLGFPPAPASNFSSQLMSPISYPSSIHPAAMLPMASNLPDPRTLFIPTVASGHPVVQQHGDPHLNLISPLSSVLGLGNAPPMSGGFTANTDMRNQFWIPSNMNMGRRGPI
ncbi:unnamed protein product [Calicophoron daubneyi]|uniref:Uncharacterized protein n=1 Tax=Calicophoron daubneyi TaxID=300641 RepID=A0AAV2THL4_CALDB